VGRGQNHQTEEDCIDEIVIDEKEQGLSGEMAQAH
jgi:hypothetical protein